MPHCVQIFFGHHKAGTRFVGNVMAMFCERVGIRYVEVNNPKWFEYDLKKAISGTVPQFVNYMNADYAYATQLDNFNGFHLVRDARDLAISAYYSHKNSHETEWWPELITHRALLMELDFNEGLLLDMDFTDQLPTDGFPITVFRAMDQWNYDDPRITEIKFETLIQAPVDVLGKVFQKLGLLKDGSSERRAALAGAIYENRFEKLSGGRQPGERDEGHHYRAGIPGEWRRLLSPVHKAWFKDKYPDLLIKTGYEMDASW